MSLRLEGPFQSFRDIAQWLGERGIFEESGGDKNIDGLEEYKSQQHLYRPVFLSKSLRSALPNMVANRLNLRHWVVGLRRGNDVLVVGMSPLTALKDRMDLELPPQMSWGGGGEKAVLTPHTQYALLQRDEGRVCILNESYMLEISRQKWHDVLEEYDLEKTGPRQIPVTAHQLLMTLSSWKAVYNNERPHYHVIARNCQHYVRYLYQELTEETYADMGLDGSFRTWTYATVFLSTLVLYLMYRFHLRKHIPSLIRP